MADRNVALVKRQQIEKAGRMMFAAVAGASVIVGVTIVGSIFMGRMLVFNSKIISAENKTVAVLKADNEVVPTLRDNVRKLNSDESLMNVPPRLKKDELPIRVILDALPDSENDVALGASLQDVLLPNDTSSIQNLNVGAPTNDDGSAVATDTSTTAAPATGDGSLQTIPFSVDITAHSPQEALNILTRLQHSIRAINITSLKLEMSSTPTNINFSAKSSITMNISGVAYYQPAVTLDLQDTTVEP